MLADISPLKLSGLSHQFSSLDTINRFRNLARKSPHDLPPRVVPPSKLKLDFEAKNQVIVSLDRSN
jgi:hypothetical protein